MTGELLLLLKGHIRIRVTFCVPAPFPFGGMPLILPKGLLLGLALFTVGQNEDQTSFCKYRPISLLPVISKVIEKVIYNQMYSFFY